MLTIDSDQTADGFTVCWPVGEFDAFSVSHFRQVFAEIIGADPVIIDLSEVALIDSAGLRALISGIRGVREHGGDVAVACDRLAIRRLLLNTGFDYIVTLNLTISEAAAALRDPRPPRPHPPVDIRSCGDHPAV